MPREIVHFEVLSAARAVIPKELQVVSTALDSYPELALLGSIAPDAPYYHVKDPSFKHVGEIVHGTNGENTYKIPAQALQSSSAKSPSLLAFIAGYLSHVATDQIFHPLVFSQTGDYYHTDPTQAFLARGRHRYFETVLDNFWKEKFNCKFSSINFLIKSNASDLRHITNLLDRVCQTSGWQLAIESLAKYKARFTSLTWALFAPLLVTLNPKLKEYAGLFNCFISASNDFSEKLNYRHPISGDEITTDFDQLRSEAINNTIRTWQLFLPLIKRELSDTKFIDSNYGNSLNFNLPNCPVSLFKYSSIPEWVARYKRS